MTTPRPSWRRIGGALVAVVLATTTVMPATAYASASPDKSETVHVQTDASGNISSITVDELLANDAGTQRLPDSTTLTNIVPADKDQSYAVGSDGDLTWSTNGEPVSYTGASTAQPPVAVRVSYLLDGVARTPADLAGASGHLVIRIDYRRVQDASGTTGSANVRTNSGVGTPFVCMSVAMLDDEVFSNVKVTNGRVLEDKGGLAVVGLALPGLADDLSIDGLDVNLLSDLPEYLEIEADVHDLVLDPIHTVVTPELFSELDANKLDLGLNDLDGGADALEAAMSELVAGTGALDDALDELAKGSEAVSGGARQLREALNVLPSGIGALSEGAHGLADALATAGEPIGLLVEGADQLATGIDGVQALVASAQGSVQASAATVDGLGATVASLTAEAGPVATATAAANDGKAAAEDASSALVALDEQLRGWDAPVNEALGTISTETAEATNDVDAASTDVSAASAALATISTEGMTDEQKVALSEAQRCLASAQGSLAEATGDLDAAASGVTSAQNAVAAVTIAPPKGLAHDIDRLGTSAASLMSAQEELDTAAGELAATSDVSATLAEADGALAQAQDLLGSLSEGATRESAGLSSLASALAQASEGAQSLARGADQLAGAAPQLVAGADELANGSSQLSSALAASSEGSSQLLEGIRTFDDEGVHTLANELRNMGGDLHTLEGRLEELRASARAYDSFAGKAQGQSGSVRFIYKTERIG